MRTSTDECSYDFDIEPDYNDVTYTVTLIWNIKQKWKEGIS